MDTTKDNVEDTLEQLRRALKNIKTEVNSTDDITTSCGYESVLSGNYTDTITLSNSYHNTTVNNSTINYPNAAVYGATVGMNHGTWAAPLTASNSGKIKLDGDGADIEINGVSLLNLLQDRLNVLIPNPALEKEWDELKELGNKYRALERKLKEQSDMWSKLKALSPDSLT